MIAKVVDSVIGNTDRKVCATEASFHTLVQTFLTVQIVKSNFVRNFITGFSWLARI